jgi:1-acyl-sn-glycerol-3-phosphate acyltransferase
MRQRLGSVLFTTLLFASVALYGPIALASRLFGYRTMYAAVELWARAMLWLLDGLCDLGYEVQGLEHLPAENGVILMKHSSAWETIAQLCLFPRQTWVMKRELIWAPILGWAIFCLKPIPINRKGGRTAVEQVIRHGCRRLEEGLWIVIFPEGTRVPLGQTRRYGLGGALLAREAGRDIVPVAHNAGAFWPRRSLLKRAGTIRVVIGPPIPTAGREPRAINQAVQDWIESALRAMP